LAKELSEQLKVSGELSAAYEATKAKAFAWCARTWARENPAHARDLLAEASSHGHCEQSEVAELIINAYDGRFDESLGKLVERPTPSRLSAALLLSANIKGWEFAGEWIDTGRVNHRNLDPDGKHAALLTYRTLNKSREAFELCESLTPDDYERNVGLLNRAAEQYVLEALPTEVRQNVFIQFPLTRIYSLLSGDSHAMECREKARNLWSQAEQLPPELTTQEAVRHARDGRIWLDLADVNRRAEVLQDIQDSLGTGNANLLDLAIALQFENQFDLQVVEELINRETALSAGMSMAAGQARLSYAMSLEDQSKTAAYIDRHRAQVTRFFQENELDAYVCQELAAAGRTAEATLRLEQLQQRGVNDSELNRLQRLIDEAQGVDRVDSRLAQFRQSNGLSDLRALVGALIPSASTERLIKYSRLLFDRTHNDTDAEVYAKALYRAGDYDTLLTFLSENQAVVDRLLELKAMKATVLYNDGDLRAAHSLLPEIQNYEEGNISRQLFIAISVASGNWEALNVFVNEEWERRSTRNASQLVYAANVAQLINSGRARELVALAAQIGSTDPKVLINCYSLATEGGYPPSIRASILEDEDLSQRFGYKPTTHLHFGSSGVSFDRGLLYERVRLAANGSGEIGNVLDEVGTAWTVDVSKTDNGIFVRLQSGPKALYLGSFFGMSDDRDLRLRCLRLTAEAHHLDELEIAYYEAILGERPFTDAEHTAYGALLRDTPIGKSSSIIEALRSGSISLGMLFPESSKYYERLLGVRPSHDRIEDFVAHELTAAIDAAVQSNGLAGLKQVLPLCGSALCTTAFSSSPYVLEHIGELVSWAVDNADLISQTAILELSLPLLHEKPQLAHDLGRIIEQLLNGNAGVPNSPGVYAQYGTLLSCSLGEISRLGIMRTLPAYIARLCAIAHASLLAKAFKEAMVDVSALLDTLDETDAQGNFYLKALVDLREAPRWLPDFLSPEHIKRWIMVRLVAAIVEGGTAVSGVEVGMTSEGVTLFNQLMENLPTPLCGPLEGAVKSEMLLPENVVLQIKESLASPVLNAMSFAQLSNAAILTEIDPELAALATDALRRVRYEVSSNDDDEWDLLLLFGLAIVAAVSRSKELASDIHTLARIKRRSLDRRESGLEIRLMFMAAAAFLDREEWAQFIGAWMMSVARSTEQPDVASWLTNCIDKLTIYSPSLIPHVAKAYVMLSQATKNH
jgi:hypothetical protein